MNTPEQEIEDMLRLAPAPTPPAGLRHRLVGQIKVVSGLPKAQAPARALHSGSWLGRWWPALGPTAVSLACAMVVFVQQMELRDLRQTIQSLSQAAAGAAPAPASGTAHSFAAGGPPETEQQEVARLQDLAKRMAGEVGQLGQLRAENEKLRAQIAAATTSRLTPDEDAALAEAREKGASIQCNNNLKQLCVAVEVWAQDNDMRLPPDMQCMSNEIGKTVVLICPSDKGRQVAANWSTYTPANCSYEYLGGSGGRSDEEADRVLFRCPIHGSIGMADASVQPGVAKARPESLVQKDGKLYWRPSRAQSEEPAPPAPTQDSNPNPNQ
ncbi:MAG: hypothetical protein ACLQVX_22220 [Limisphaerales bacterium]